MVFKKIIHPKITRFHKIKVLVKIWKVQIKIPFQLIVQKKDGNIRMKKWVICQILN